MSLIHECRKVLHMTYCTINPANERLLQEFVEQDDAQIGEILARANTAFRDPSGAPASNSKRSKASAHWGTLGACFTTSVLPTMRLFVHRIGWDKLFELPLETSDKDDSTLVVA